MKAKYQAKQVAEAVKAHPFNLDHITLESGLSWPVPVIQNDQLLFSFFYCPAGGPIGNWTIGCPYYRALADPDSIENIRFTPVGPSDFGIDLPLGQPLAKFDESYLNDLTRDQYLAMTERFYRLIDEILPIYLKPVASLSRREKEIVSEYYSLFQKLTQKPLWPVYESVNPEFFKWVEAINAT